MTRRESIKRICRATLDIDGWKYTATAGADDEYAECAIWVAVRAVPTAPSGRRGENLLAHESVADVAERLAGFPRGDLEFLETDDAAGLAFYRPVTRA